jgi:hypothetical protein
MRPEELQRKENASMTKKITSEEQLEFLERIQNVVGDLVNASSELVAMIERDGWPWNGQIPEDFQELVKRAQVTGRQLASCLSTPVIMAYLATLTEVLYQRVKK